MKKLLCLILCLVCFAVKSNVSDKPFSIIYKVIEANDAQLYIVTDNGTWRLNGQTAIKIGANESLAVEISSKDFQQLKFPEVAIHEPNWNALFLFVVGALLASSVFLLQRAANIKNKQYMASLRQQKRLMDLCFWVTGDTVLDCDVELNYVEKVTNNDSYFQIDGMPFLNEAYRKRIHPDDLAMYRGQYESIMSSGNNSFQIMYRFDDLNGGWKWIVERGCVMERNADGQAKRIVINLRDETDLRREQTNLVRINHVLEKKIKLLTADK